ncbi:NAD(P)-binding domain-containing protein [Chryseolinea sp. T2]|uniref:NAD(P)-binding domain-containing protein n=1 Tax=Chryseolinea sp. T2 TaxID=3129255 RepID=UPI0030775AC4
MNGNIFEVIVVGAGPSGLMCSYYLKHLGLEHILFDRGRLAESWRSQRWDNFRMITPFKANLLPGAKLKTRKPDAYGSAADMVTMLQEYVSAFQLPVTEQAQVLSVEKAPNSPVFQVKVIHDNEMTRTYDAWQVVVAAGISNRPVIPPIAISLPKDIDQLHSSGYRQENKLKPGGVLVVGGGQSGLEIAHDLLSQGRSVWLSSAPHAQLPRDYRGNDIFQWLADSRVLEEGFGASHPMPAITYPLDDEVAITRSSLANRGVRMIGELARVEGQKLVFPEWKKEAIDSANAYSSSILRAIDQRISGEKLASPPYEGNNTLDALPVAEVLDLIDAGITNVIWATGYSGSIPDIEYPVSTEQMQIQSKGLTSVEGFYVVGGAHTANSDYVVGAKDQASFVTNHIYGILR